MWGERRTAALGTAGMVVLALFVTACTAPLSPVAPHVPPSTVPPASQHPSQTPAETFHEPAPGEHWQAGKTLALPCPPGGKASSASLLREGQVTVDVEGYGQPMIQLRAGGRLDLADGVLGVSGSEWITGDDYEDFPGELTHLRVPRGTPVVTIARVWDAAANDSMRGTDLAAAEVRLSDAVPVRWAEHGWAGTDVGQGAWFGSAARARLEDTGYDPLFQFDDKGRSVSEVAGSWDVPCYSLDVAPRETGQVHDVLIVGTGAPTGSTSGTTPPARRRTPCCWAWCPGRPWACRGRHRAETRGLASAAGIQVS